MRDSARACLLILLALTVVSCGSKKADPPVEPPPTGPDTFLEQAAHGVAESPDAEGYDAWKVYSAADILPAELLKGPHHQVKDEVVLFGPQFSYRITSDYGPFDAQGEAMLRRQIADINAIAKLKEMGNTKEFADAMKTSLLNPFDGLKSLLLHPAKTVSGIPKGLHTYWASAEEGLKGGESESEDGLTESMLTVSKYKRELAGELGVDVYSTNPVLQEEMNRIGWAGALGRWTPAIGTMPLSGPASVIDSTLSWTDTLNDVLSETPPDLLRSRARDILEELGLKEDLVTQFLHHPTISPRQITVITMGCKAMKGVDGLHTILEKALVSNSDIDSVYYQITVEMLAGYHEKQSPLEKILDFRGLPAGLSEEGTLVAAIPIDYARWNRFSEGLMKGLRDYASDEAKAKAQTLVITGTASPLVRENLPTYEIELVEKVGEKFKLAF